MHSRINMWSQSLCFIIIVLLTCTATPVSKAFSAVETSGSGIAEKEYPKNINVKEAAEKRENGAFFLDVREPDEWKELHIPDSVLIPVSQLQKRLDELPKDRDIVIICLSGGRSRVVLDFIRRKGFLRSSCMQGGIRMWRQSGYPVEKGE